mgnify:CR=1 FL=1
MMTTTTIAATIETPAFVAAMESHWTGELCNVSSPALRAVWAQLADTFNQHIAAHDELLKFGEHMPRGYHEKRRL